MPLNIVEHDTSNVTVTQIERAISEMVKLDEQTLKCDLTKLTTTGPAKKKSLFAQHMESKRQKMSAGSNGDRQKMATGLNGSDQQKMSIDPNNGNQQRRSTGLNAGDQQMPTTTLNDQASSSIHSTPPTNLIDGSGLFEDAELARREAEAISAENDAKLKELNESEKRQLLEQFNLANLDPKLLEFIKSRSKAKQKQQPGQPDQPSTSAKAQQDSKTSELPPRRQDSATSEPSVRQQDSRAFEPPAGQQDSTTSELPAGQKDSSTRPSVQKDVVTFDLPTTAKPQEPQEPQEDAPLIDEEEIRRNRWLHMDRVEKEKLEWMKPLLENEKKKSSQNRTVEGKAARFNFEGDLVLQEDLDHHLGLHHHSEQDTAAGYTLNELIALTQSKFIPQRVLALNTLAAVFRRMHRGYFDICFDKSLTIELLEQTETVLLLRRLLDDANVSLQLVSIKCIHALICNTIYDEFALDRLFCSMELGVEVPKLCYAELANEAEYKDEQLCRLDVVSCLIRTNLLPRLRYLLDQLLLRQQSDPIVIDHILDLLIRVCRHSAKACQQLADTPHLLDCLIRNFIAPSSSQLNWKALKIIRILFTTDPKHIARIRSEYPVLMTTIRNYLITSPLNEQSTEVYSTIIEVLRVWRVLLILDNDGAQSTTEQFIELASNIRNCLAMKILVNNSFDLHYVSNLLHCLAYVIQRQPSMEHFFTPLVQQLTFQWFREIVNDNELPQLDGCLAVSSALLYLSWSSTSPEQLTNYVLKPILDSPQLLGKLTGQLLSGSSILAFQEYHNSIYRDSKALPSYGSIYFGGQTIRLNQLLNERSTVFLIGPLVGLAAKHRLTDCLQQFLYNPQIRKYLDAVVKQANRSSNWTIFELIEFNPVSQLILWERNVLQKNEYADHALVVLSSVGDLQLKQSLCECVFDVREYKAAYDRLSGVNGGDDPMEERDKNQKENMKTENEEHTRLQDQLIKSSISFFNEIKKVYSKYSTFEDRSWPFEPLVKLYQLQLNADCTLTESELVDQLASCLNYLLLLYRFRSNYLWSLVEPKILFVYLSSVFLFRNALFLNEQLLRPLRYFFVELTTEQSTTGQSTTGHKQQPVTFDCYEEKVPEPFGSIGDHFSALCTTFRTDSYGNALFSNYLLCFVQQSADRIFRKKLLDEHAACLNYFVLTKDQLLLRLDRLTEPVESDLSVIESYVRVLMSREILEQRNPLIYELACTHVTRSLFDDHHQEIRLQNSELADKLIGCLRQSTNTQLKKRLAIVN